MASNTLADEFLADLGEDDEGAVGSEEEEEAVPMEEDLLENEEAEDKMADDKLLETLRNVDIQKVARLISSDRFKDLIQRIDAQMQQPRTNEIVGPLEEDPEYQLIVESNAIVAEIHNEIQLIHKYIRDLYAKKFPELESLVLNPLDYARVVKRIGNQLDLTVVELNDIIPAATVMVVTVAASTTSGKALDDEEFKRVIDACDMALNLDDARKKILEYVESRMTFIAPNMSALVGSAVAAKLIAAAGGLVALSKIPASNIQLLGAPKRHLAGFSTSQQRRYMTGYIFDCDIMNKTPPSLRTKAIRVLATKVTLAARIDAGGGDKNGNEGRQLREYILKKIEKLQEPPPPKLPKPLPAPDDKLKKKRGGRRVRKMKEKYAVTDLRKHANRMAFGIAEEETVAGRGLGMIGVHAASGKVRLTAQEKNLLKKQKQQQKNYGSSGLTSGLASSLAFTPVQGLELANPEAAAQRELKVKLANERYFAGGGFLQVAKKQKTDNPSPSGSNT
jgi:U4/U6 small nuclear ribonucleoprotein PRP31